MCMYECECECKCECVCVCCALELPRRMATKLFMGDLVVQGVIVTKEMKRNKEWEEKKEGRTKTEKKNIVIKRKSWGGGGWKGKNTMVSFKLCHLTTPAGV